MSNPSNNPSRRTRRGTPLLTNSNRNLARDGIYSWTIPALAARLPDGTTVKTCPSAGVCAQACYARNGSYNYANVKAAHLRNLALVVEDLEGWETAMKADVAWVAARERRRDRQAYVRIHDAGDFFSDDYTQAWLRVIEASPDVEFYAYTKEVDRMRRLAEPRRLDNFRWVYSMGGTQDDLLDPTTDRVADVFPTEEAIWAAGYHSQAASDLLAVTGPAPVGMSANKIPQFQARQGSRTFSSWQRQENQRRGPR